MPEFSVPIQFNEKTQAAMMAFVRFLHYRRLSLDRPHKEHLKQFRDYASKNQLIASKPDFCTCTHEISESEVVFNVCRKCKRKYLDDTI